VGLDGSTYNVKTGSMRFRLPVQDVSLRFGPAGTQAADNPLDLRLRYIKVQLSLAALLGAWALLCGVRRASGVD